MPDLREFRIDPYDDNSFGLSSACMVGDVAYVSVSDVFDGHDQEMPLERWLAWEKCRPAAGTKNGIEVTVTDLLTGESQTSEIENDYIIVCAGNKYVSHVQNYPTKGTVVLTIKTGSVDG